jgi:hypothetical protein
MAGAVDGQLHSTGHTRKLLEIIYSFFSAVTMQNAAVMFFIWSGCTCLVVMFLIVDGHLRT